MNNANCQLVKVKFLATFFVFAFALEHGVVGSEAGSGSVASEFSWSTTASGPICGPYAVSAAMRRLGADVSPKSFVSAKYVGTCAGASQRQLIAAIEDSGFSAYPGDGLSVLDLNLVDLPFIALVRSDPSTKKYSHWVTVDQGEAGNLLVFDAGKPAYSLSPAEFMGMWSGTGLFVSNAASHSPRSQILMTRLALLFASLAVVLLAFEARSIRRFSWFGESASLVGINLVFCVGALWLFGDLSNRNLGLQTVVAPYTADLKPISMAEAVTRTADSEAILIDARREVDFQADAIRNAVNVPVYASRDDVGQFLRNIDMKTDIYVYCQSAGCNFDNKVGRLIASLGFESIYVCDEGIYEYRQSTSKVDL